MIFYNKRSYSIKSQKSYSSKVHYFMKDGKPGCYLKHSSRRRTTTEFNFQSRPEEAFFGNCIKSRFQSLEWFSFVVGRPVVRSLAMSRNISVPRSLKLLIETSQYHLNVRQLIARHYVPAAVKLDRARFFV